MEEVASDFKKIKGEGARPPPKDRVAGPPKGETARPDWTALEGLAVGVPPTTATLEDGEVRSDHPNG